MPVKAGLRVNAGWRVNAYPAYNNPVPLCRPDKAQAAIRHSVSVTLEPVPLCRPDKASAAIRHSVSDILEPVALL